MTPRHVDYEGKRWRVIGVDTVDDKLQYRLVCGIGKHARAEWAWAADCTPATRSSKPQVRRLKDGGVVLEFDSRGQVFLRKHGARRRYPTCLSALYDSTVKAAVAAEKFAKRQVRKGRKS